jgi:hypothetical protein
MESFMVKYYCDILIPNESCEVVSSVTEDLVHLFLKIRGYAVTRLERNKLQKSWFKTEWNLVLPAQMKKKMVK